MVVDEAVMKLFQLYYWVDEVINVLMFEELQFSHEKDTCKYEMEECKEESVGTDQN